MPVPEVFAIRGDQLARPRIERDENSAHPGAGKRVLMVHPIRRSAVKDVAVHQHRAVRPRRAGTHPGPSTRIVFPDDIAIGLLQRHGRISSTPAMYCPSSWNGPSLPSACPFTVQAQDLRRAGHHISPVAHDRRRRAHPQVSAVHSARLPANRSLGRTGHRELPQHLPRLFVQTPTPIPPLERFQAGVRLAGLRIVGADEDPAIPPTVGLPQTKVPSFTTPAHVLSGTGQKSRRPSWISRRLETVGQPRLCGHHVAPPDRSPPHAGQSAAGGRRHGQKDCRCS